MSREKKLFSSEVLFFDIILVEDGRFKAVAALLFCCCCFVVVFLGYLQRQGTVCIVCQKYIVIVSLKSVTVCCVCVFFISFGGILSLKLGSCILL